MLKIFLVDDEIIVRESIRSSIDWDKTNYSLVGEAPDGEMALSMMMDLKPDILVTDIRMPFMDGLALTSIVKRNMPWVRIIILSGHDEFEYAKQAITLGVSAYLLKPVSPDELLQTLGEVAEEIDEEKQKQQNLERLQRQLENSSTVRSEKMLEDLITGAISTADALDIAKTQGISLLARHYLIMTLVVQIKGQSPIPESENGCLHPERLLRIKVLLQKAVNKQNSLAYFYSSMNRFVTLLKGDNVAELEEDAYIQAQSLRHIIETEFGCELTIAIGSVVDRIAEIQISYADADMILRRMGALGSGKTYSSRDMTVPTDAALKQLSSQMLGEKIKYAARQDLPHIVDEHFRQIGEQPLESLLLSYYILMDVLIVSSRMIEEYGGLPAEIIPETVRSEQLTAIASSSDLLKAKILDLLDRTLAYRDSRLGSRYADVIRKACSFIEDNFMRPDLSLNQVAAHVSLSNNHFCTVFAQETGKTFIEYLTAIRIDKAAELLRSTQMLASEIAYASGYNDPHYFSYIFKKHKGIPPREYRNQEQPGRS